MTTRQRSRQGSPAQVKETDWSAALGSGDPAQQWAAACSIALTVTAHDDWVDATALHEAAVGAYDAAVNAGARSRVYQAMVGARRALHWERRARFALVPPVAFGSHRWRAEARSQGDPAYWLEPVDDEAMAQPCRPQHPVKSAVAAWVAARLTEAGWPWHPEPVIAVTDVIDMVGLTGRDEARKGLADRYPSLPRVVVNNLILLVAGSRMRDGLGWPGVVWLDAHYGTRAAQANRGTIAVLTAIKHQRRGRPTNSISITGEEHHLAAAIPIRRCRSTTGPRAGIDSDVAVAS